MLLNPLHYESAGDFFVWSDRPGLYRYYEGR